MAGKSVELGGGVWDPLGLADLGSEKTLRWFRAAEVKVRGHSFVALFRLHILLVSFVPSTAASLCSPPLAGPTPAMAGQRLSSPEAPP